MLNPMPCGSLIKQLHDRIEKSANNALRASDLTLMQVGVLMELRGADHQQQTMKELERTFGVAQSTVAGIVSRLEQKGFVEALVDVGDKRVKLVHLTDVGAACSVDAAEHMSASEDRLLQGFSRGERELFAELLARAADNMK